jgi:hypothetical protein
MHSGVDRNEAVRAKSKVMISLLIAGGISLAAAPQTTAFQWPDINNHTLLGQAVPAKDVVCRNRWGTPMLPDGKGGYSLIAPINKDWIRESLYQPPYAPNGMVAYRPLPPAQETVTITEQPIPQPATTAPTAPAPVNQAPVEPTLPSADTTAPAAPATDGGFTPDAPQQ